MRVTIQICGPELSHLSLTGLAVDLQGTGASLELGLLTYAHLHMASSFCLCTLLSAQVSHKPISLSLPELSTQGLSGSSTLPGLS